MVDVVSVLFDDIYVVDLKVAGEINKSTIAPKAKDTVSYIKLSLRRTSARSRVVSPSAEAVSLPLIALSDGVTGHNGPSLRRRRRR